MPFFLLPSAMRFFSPLPYAFLLPCALCFRPAHFGLSYLLEPPLLVCHPILHLISTLLAVELSPLHRASATASQLSTSPGAPLPTSSCAHLITLCFEAFALIFCRRAPRARASPGPLFPQLQHLHNKATTPSTPLTESHIVRVCGSPATISSPPSPPSPSRSTTTIGHSRKNTKAAPSSSAGRTRLPNPSVLPAISLRSKLRLLNTSRTGVPSRRRTPLHAGQVILQPLSSSGPATSAPSMTDVTLNRSSGAEPLACASPMNSEAMS